MGSNHLDSSTWLNNHLLCLYRVLCFITIFSITIYHCIADEDPTLIYFTNWGIYFTCATYTFFSIHSIRQYICIKSEDELRTEKLNLYSSWVLWKWAVFLYETSLSFEVIITLFFWGVLFDPDDNDVWDYVDHILPIAILVLDYAMNRVPFIFRHLAVSINIMFIYGLVNLLYTLSTGTPVYPPLNFKDALSYVWLLVLAFLECATYYGLTVLTRWKIGKIINSERYK